MMDIPVSRLNNRMALQLPAQLPLGLVFVVGEINGLAEADDGSLNFRIREGEYFLRCRLTSRAAAAATLNNGDRVRAGGHLAFDPNAAHYFLLARDIEIVAESARPTERPRSALASILEDVKRRSEATSLVAAELPPWVQKLAPPEVQAEMGWSEDPPAPVAEEDTISAATVEAAEALTSPEDTGLTDELFALLSDAMDSDEEVELTPEILAQWSVATHVGEDGGPAEQMAAAGPTEAPDFPLPGETESVPPLPVADPLSLPAEPDPAPAAAQETAPATRPRQPRDRGLEYLIVGLALGMLILIGVLLVWFLLLGL